MSVPTSITGNNTISQAFTMAGAKTTRQVVNTVLHQISTRATFQTSRDTIRHANVTILGNKHTIFLQYFHGVSSITYISANGNRA